MADGGGGSAYFSRFQEIATRDYDQKIRNAQIKAASTYGIGTSVFIAGAGLKAPNVMISGMVVVATGWVTFRSEVNKADIDFNTTMQKGQSERLKGTESKRSSDEPATEPVKSGPEALPPEDKPEGSGPADSPTCAGRTCAAEAYYSQYCDDCPLHPMNPSERMMKTIGSISMPREFEGKNGIMGGLQTLVVGDARFAYPAASELVGGHLDETRISTQIQKYLDTVKMQHE